MKQKKYTLVWSASERYGSIFYPTRRRSNSEINRYYPSTEGLARLVQNAKRILRAGFAAGYQLKIYRADYRAPGGLSLVDLNFTK